VDLPKVRVLPMKPSDHKPTTPDGQPLRYGVCRCKEDACNIDFCVDMFKAFGKLIALPWCKCFCHEEAYRKLNENKGTA